jgi:hypothetical protein
MPSLPIWQLPTQQLRYVSLGSPANGGAQQAELASVSWSFFDRFFTVYYQ